MLIARVIGNVVATQKNQRYEGARVMLCRQITPEGEDMDYTCLALDSVDSGEGDKPLDALVVSPHPDDAELGMGGTIIRLLQRGWTVRGRSMRPDHRMVAHTGFLTFARRLAGSEVFEAESY